jgi:RsiW-degrading membrane proteinase PrsW (M82 family)
MTASLWRCIRVSKTSIFAVALLRPLNAVAENHFGAQIVEIEHPLFESCNGSCAESYGLALVQVSARASPDKQSRSNVIGEPVPREIMAVGNSVSNSLSRTRSGKKADNERMKAEDDFTDDVEKNKKYSNRDRLHVDLSPDMVGMKRGFWSKLLSPPRQYHFRYLRFFRIVREESQVLGPAKKDMTVSGTTMWLVWLVLGMIATGLATWFICESMKVYLPHEPNLVSARGRPCWTIFCILLVFLLSITVFQITLQSILLVNKEVSVWPERVIKDDNQQPVYVHTYAINDPGRGCFEAAHGVWLSMAAGSLFAMGWRYHGNVQVSGALLAAFSLRGATLALIIALALEIVSDMLLSGTGISDDGPLWGCALSNLLVGIFEEGAKLLVVVLGTCICASLLRQRSERTTGYWGSFSADFLQRLLESPHAFMLAGVAVGFGFMTTENASYMMAVASTPRVDYTYADGKTEEDGGLFVATATILVRLLLNIHPWWAGLSAGRLASMLFDENSGYAMPSVTVFIVAIAPSATLHGAYDFFVGGSIPDVFALFAPPVFWLFSRFLFQWEWNQIHREAPIVISIEDDRVRKPQYNPSMKIH